MVITCTGKKNKNITKQQIIPRLHSMNPEITLYKNK